MKRITLIGDIGWRSFYHLGDEAMTEFAIDALRRRTNIEVTLIAGHPDHAREMYGVDTIARMGFTRDRPRNLARMDRILAHVESDGVEGDLSPTDPARAVIESVRNSDAVLIAGGGNLNSMFAHHIYERVTIGRIATLLGKPYALTSQTLGPLIFDEDRRLVYEFLADAEFVGSRESFTTRFARDVGGKRAVVARQVDDAFSLEATDHDREAIADLAAEPFILASYAEKASSPVLRDADYHALLIEITRRLTDETGLRVLLVPHGGGLPPAVPTRDQITNLKIAEAVDRDTVKPTRMLTARQLVALTERAEFVIGSRYHAGIFAGAAAVPFISLVPNLYSSIRMRGAAENLGMEQFVLPVESVDSVVATGVGFAANRESLHESLNDCAARRRAEHEQWWDFVIAHTVGDESGVRPDISAASADTAAVLPGDSTVSSNASPVPAPGFVPAEEVTNSFDPQLTANRARLSAIEDYGLLLARQDRQLAVARGQAREVTNELEQHRTQSRQQQDIPLVRVALRAHRIQRRARRVLRRAANRLTAAGVDRAK